MVKLQVKANVRGMWSIAGRVEGLMHMLQVQVRDIWVCCRYRCRCRTYGYVAGIGAGQGYMGILHDNSTEK